MRFTARLVAVGIAGLAVCAGSLAVAQDWPQWRGVDREARISGFNAPAEWPAELTRKWSVPAGEGDASPSLVGNRLYVFGRQNGEEVTQCLNAETGDVIWRDSYASEGATGGASGHSGPRSSPTIAEGRVITMGVRGILSCFDAETGSLEWRKTDYPDSWPQFFVSSSPIVVNDLCIAQRGEGIIAYDLASGDERWQVSGAPAYSSPVLMTIDQTPIVIAPTENELIALSAADGSEMWKIQYQQGGRYNSATPIVNGDTLIVAGPGSGMTAFRLTRQGDRLTHEQLWRNTDNSVQYNTPVIKNDLLFGLSTGDQLFCIRLGTGETAWSAPFPQAAGQVFRFSPNVGQTFFAQRGGRRGRRGGGGMRGGGYGSVVDAGSVLIGLTPAGRLAVFEPAAEGLNTLATYTVAEGNTYAYPIPSRFGIFTKDYENVTLWNVE